MIFLGLLNFLARLRHPRAYAEHQRRVAELNEHLDHHRRPISIVGCVACDERDGRVSEELCQVRLERVTCLRPMPCDKHPKTESARRHMDCFTGTKAPFTGCLVNSPDCPHRPSATASGGV